MDRSVEEVVDWTLAGVGHEIGRVVDSQQEAKIVSGTYKFIPAKALGMRPRVNATVSAWRSCHVAQHAQHQRNTQGLHFRHGYSVIVP